MERSDRSVRVRMPCATSRVDLEGRMAHRRAESEELQESYAVATAKIRMWRSRAELARLSGRKDDADRCDDKVRDWASRAKQIEQQLAERSRPAH
jgi:hypothetical protein